MVIKNALYATQAQYNIIDRWTEIRKVIKQFRDRLKAVHDCNGSSLKMITLHKCSEDFVLFGIKLAMSTYSYRKGILL